MLIEKDFSIIEKQAIALYSELELAIIEEIALRIANVGYINTVTYNNIVILEEMGYMYEDIEIMVARQNNMNIEEIQSIFETAGIKSIKRDDKIYALAGIKTGKISDKLMNTIKANAKKTGNNILKLTNTTAGVAQLQFINAINKAYLETSTGSKSYSQAIRDAVKKVSKQGAYVQYPSGAKRSVENAVSMNILTSINRTSAELQIQRGDEFGYDMYEVSAHIGARPEHAEWQGKVYTKQELYDICGLDTVTGLCGINCRHTFYPYVEGSTRRYTNKELNYFKNEKIEYDGRRISTYDASQIQRGLERNIRSNKKEIAGLKGILQSDNKDIDKKEIQQQLILSRNKLREKNAKLNDFIEQTGLHKDNTRLVI